MIRIATSAAFVIRYFDSGLLILGLVASLLGAAWTAKAVVIRQSACRYEVG